MNLQASSGTAPPSSALAVRQSGVIKARKEKTTRVRNHPILASRTTQPRNSCLR
ncbi:hypothetical protein BOX15_Mlig028216g1 [Macrostomum lignano]|uniref:Uncharacterized protein n=1 Tax=Macrostomum lignano TaxID=282301 RepID=A0A267GSV3_9PLAT|nr:hypothetical protein BOX15_Mlig028216g2 [Macrostomum lignano]PAA88389.1 hypothetical protein BOX15_Mlig028216g1 [Macrostomum lignano]